MQSHSPLSLIEHRCNSDGCRAAGAAAAMLLLTNFRYDAVLLKHGPCTNFNRKQAREPVSAAGRVCDRRDARDAPALRKTDFAKRRLPAIAR